MSKKDKKKKSQRQKLKRKIKELKDRSAVDNILNKPIDFKRGIKQLENMQRLTEDREMNNDARELTYSERVLDGQRGS